MDATTKAETTAHIARVYMELDAARLNMPRNAPQVLRDAIDRALLNVRGAYVAWESWIC